MAGLSVILVLLLGFGFICFIGACVTLFIYGLAGLIEYVARVK